jgi:hypothetical protein
MLSLRTTTFLATLIVALSTSLASTATVRAQVVQLPTFQYFTVSTSVLVPDRGGAYLGGISRARSGSVSSGLPLVGKLPGAGRLFRNESLASSRSTSGVSVSATIIDNAELDRAVLAAAAARTGDSTIDPTLARRASFLASNVATHRPAATRLADSNQVAGPSVAELREANELAQQQREADLQQWLQRGRDAEAAGKLGAARIYYKTAARQAPESLRRQILAYVENDLGKQAVASSTR